MSGDRAAGYRDPHFRTRRLWSGVMATAAAVALGGVALGGVAWVAVGAGGGNGAQGVADALPPKTAPVRRQTLKESRTETGTLGYGRAKLLAPRTSGTVTWLPAVGDVIGQGRPLLGVDDDPVLLLYGGLPAYRRMATGTHGRDVRQLERALGALGYRGFTADDVYTSATAVAVRRWQRAAGLSATGRVELGQVVFTPGEVRVSALSASVGDPALAGRAVFSYTGTEPRVTVALDVVDQRLAREGATVTVKLPDGAESPGRIASVTTVAETDDKNKQVTRIEVEVVPDEPADGFDSAAVDVVFTASVRKNVLTVPVTALLALAEGGYGVEVISGGTGTVVAVQTGLFANGRVEVTGGGLAEGIQVGVPG